MRAVLGSWRIFLKNSRSKEDAAKSTGTRRKPEITTSLFQWSPRISSSMLIVEIKRGSIDERIGVSADFPGRSFNRSLTDDCDTTRKGEKESDRGHVRSKLDPE